MYTFNCIILHQQICYVSVQKFKNIHSYFTFYEDDKLLEKFHETVDLAFSPLLKYAIKTKDVLIMIHIIFQLIETINKFLKKCGIFKFFF